MDNFTGQLHTMSLCSGGGGLDLGVELALGCTRTICWVEWEAFAASVLAARMEAKQVAPAPLWSDLRTFDGKPWGGCVDILTAGYPCQPFSLAGKRRGSDDPRHLWPHVRRVVAEVQPPVCFFENVSGHLSLGFGEVVTDLEALGYQVAAGLFTAEEVGASHKRERLFILAVAASVGSSDAGGEMDNPTSPRFQPAWAGESGESERRGRVSGVGCADLADANKPRPQGCRLDGQRSHQFAARSGRSTVEQPFPPGPSDHDAWETVPDAFWPAQSKVRLLADGLAADRPRWLRLFGNGVVPLQAAHAFCSLWTALVSQ